MRLVMGRDATYLKQDELVQQYARAVVAKDD